MKRLRGIIFDKDGTLFDFQASYGAWAFGFITELSGGEPLLVAVLAAELELDPTRARGDFREASWEEALELTGENATICATMGRVLIHHLEAGIPDSKQVLEEASLWEARARANLTAELAALR